MPHGEMCSLSLVTNHETDIHIANTGSKVIWPCDAARRPGDLVDSRECYFVLILQQQEGLVIGFESHVGRIFLFGNKNVEGSNR